MIREEIDLLGGSEEVTEYKVDDLFRSESNSHVLAM